MRTALIYLVIVGLPVAGTILVLESGKNLIAPRAMGGVWTMSPADGAWPQTCDDAEALRSFVVSQSGDHLTISFGERTQTPLVGRLSPMASGDRAVTIVADTAAAGAPVAGLAAAIALESAPLSMSGRLSAACAAGLSLPFRATLEPPASSRSGRP